MPLPVQYRGYAIFGGLLERINAPFNSPIIVVGTGRCGSSMLAEILDTHTELKNFSSEANDLWHPNSYPLHLATIPTPPLHEDPKAFTELSVKHWPENHGRFIRHVLAGYGALRGNGKRIFVKSATISFLLTSLLEIFPDARFVHVYRFGPSVVESMLLKAREKAPVSGDNNPNQKVDDYRFQCARYWNNCVVEVDRASTALELADRGKFFELSYEDLCADPRGMLNRLSAYLSISPEKFGFDISTIKSTNYKVKDYMALPEWAPLLKVMQPALVLKGYAI